MEYLLHDENFRRITANGKRIQAWMQAHARQVANATKGQRDPDVSILIRSRNDSEHIERLFEDIRAQVFDGKVEVIVVDTESRDDTVNIAKANGATVINITQKEFTYPKALNMGFRAAKYPWVVTLVGHSGLSNRLFLKTISYWNSRQQNLGGLYSLPLPNWNASWLERTENVIRPSVWKEPIALHGLSLGIMAGNGSIVRRDVWERLGGYDERYAGGGEDRALGGTMLAAGFGIVREPLCSVFHSHGLSIANGIRQWLHWSEVADKASPFETAKVHARRPDLR